MVRKRSLKPNGKFRVSKRISNESFFSSSVGTPQCGVLETETTQGDHGHEISHPSDKHKTLPRKSSSMFKRLAGLFKSDNSFNNPSPTTSWTSQSSSIQTPVDSDFVNEDGDKTEHITPQRRTEYEGGEELLLDSFHISQTTTAATATKLHPITQPQPQPQLQPFPSFPTSAPQFVDRPSQHDDSDSRRGGHATSVMKRDRLIILKRKSKLGRNVEAQASSSRGVEQQQHRRRSNNEFEPCNGDLGHTQTLPSRRKLGYNGTRYDFDSGTTPVNLMSPNNVSCHSGPAVPPPPLTRTPKFCPPELIAELSAGLGKSFCLKAPPPSRSTSPSISRVASYSSLSALVGQQHRDSPPRSPRSPRHPPPDNSSLVMYSPRNPPMSDSPKVPLPPLPLSPSPLQSVFAPSTTSLESRTPSTKRSSASLLNQFPAAPPVPTSKDVLYDSATSKPKKLSIITTGLTDRQSFTAPLTSLTSSSKSASSSPLGPSSSEEGTIKGHVGPHSPRTGKKVKIPKVSSRSRPTPLALQPDTSKRKIIVTRDDEDPPQSPYLKTPKSACSRLSAPIDFENLLLIPSDTNLPESRASSVPSSRTPSPITPSRCSSPELVPNPPALASSRSSRMSPRTPSTPKTEKSEPSSPKLKPLRDPFKDLRWRKDLVDRIIPLDDEETISIVEPRTNLAELEPLRDPFKDLRWRTNVQHTEPDELVHLEAVLTDTVPLSEPTSTSPKRSRPPKPLKTRTTIPLIDCNYNYTTNEETYTLVRSKSTSHLILAPTPPSSPDDPTVFQQYHHEQAERLDQLMKSLQVFNESSSRQKVSSRI